MISIGKTVAFFQQPEQFRFRQCAVQQDCDPVCLIHVVRGEDSRLLQQRTGFQRTALHIENMHRSAGRQSQLLRGNIRQQPVPFAVFSVPQNCRVRCALHNRLIPNQSTVSSPPIAGQCRYPLALLYHKRT